MRIVNYKRFTLETTSIDKEDCVCKKYHMGKKINLLIRRSHEYEKLPI
jgi:hypothetical protein